MKIVSDKTYNAAMEQMRAEVKGFYAQESAAANEYLQALSRVVKNQTQLPLFAGISRDQIVNEYKTNAVLAGIVSYISRCVGDMFTNLELTKKDTGKVDEKHWVNALLARPNDRFDIHTYGEAAYVNYALFGDEWNYAVKAVGVDKGQIKEMYCIPSHKLAVNTGDYEALFKGVKVGDKDIDAANVFEVFDYNLDDDSFFGTSRVAQAALYLTIIERGMNREATSLKNGGAANVITPRETNIAALPADKDNAEQQLNAQKNANKNVFLRVPVDVHSLGDTPVNLGILDSHKEAATVLAFVFNFPIDLIYGQSKYENAKEYKRSVYEQIAIPFVNKWAAAFLSYAGLAKDYDLTVNTDNVDILHDDPYDVATKMNACGAFTTNEIRTAAGWEEIAEPWANEVRLPLGVQIGNDPIDISEV